MYRNFNQYNYHKADEILSVLNQVSQTMDINKKSAIENYIQLQSIAISAELNNEFSDSIINTDADFLFAMADTLFAEYTPLPWDEMPPKSIKVKTSTPDIFKPDLKVYPNPSDELVFIEYNFAFDNDEALKLLYSAMGYSPNTDCKNGELRVYTNDSKLLQIIELNKQSDLKTINIADYAAGTYIIEIRDCYDNKNTVKITKNK